MIIIKKSHYCKCNNSFLKVRKLKCENYFNSTDAPASSNFFFNSSASAFATPSLTVCGAPSTRSLASFKPKPVISRTALITATFLSPAPVNTTLKSSFSSAAGASPAAAGAAARLFKEFAKTNDKFEIKGAAFEGEFIAAKDIDRLASLPTYDEAIARLMGTMKEAAAGKFVRTLAALRDKMQGEGEAA